MWDRLSASAWHIAERAGRQRKWTLLPLEIKDATDIEPAFKTAIDARADGVLVTASAHLFARGAYVAELAARSQLPTIYQLRAFVDAGRSMSSGPSLIDTWRYAAIYVDRILKGERPAELPVEQLSPAGRIQGTGEEDPIATLARSPETTVARSLYQNGRSSGYDANVKRWGENAAA